MKTDSVNQPKKRHLRVADEIFQRKARYGRDHPGTRCEMTVSQLVELKLLIPTQKVGNVQHYYFTDAGIRWYVSCRPDVLMTAGGSVRAEGLTPGVNVLSLGRAAAS